MVMANTWSFSPVTSRVNSPRSDFLGVSSFGDISLLSVIILPKSCQSHRWKFLGYRGCLEGCNVLIDSAGGRANEMCMMDTPVY